MIYSCYGCKDRKAYCHSSCERYREEKARHDSEKAKKDADKSVQINLIGQSVSGIYRAKRSRRK